MGTAAKQVELVGTSTWSINLRGRVASLSNNVGHVLITGPEGSGKKQVARAMHATGPRCNGPLVAVDCRALTPLVAASQLFGHVAGGFAFASGAALGCLQAASGGILLLEGVEQLHLSTQVVLREALASGRVTPLGADAEQPIDVQVFATSRRELAEEVAAGQFDRQLYELLSASCLETVALEQRLEDVAALAGHFLAESTTQDHKALTASATAWLKTTQWPGNISQLRELIERVARQPEQMIDYRALRALAATQSHAAAIQIQSPRKRMWGQRMPCASVLSTCMRTTDLPTCRKRAVG